MVRKPQPKAAAQAVRDYLQKDGISLSQRKALDLVALVEGYRSWQAMSGSAQTIAEPRAEANLYEQAWQQAAPNVEVAMRKLAVLLSDNLHEDYRLTGPELQQDDEFSFALHVYLRKALDDESPVLSATFALVEDEDSPSQFALSFIVTEVTSGDEKYGWTSGSRYSDAVWSSDSQELLRQLSTNFSPVEVLYVLGQPSSNIACLRA